MTDRPATPTAFISYSWDDEDHKTWVRGLAARLRGDGVDVALDQWALQPGDRLPAFMEAAVRDNDFVLIVCTPHYKDRSDKRQGGVGYEGDIMTGELLTRGNERKFIPVLRCGDEATAIPSWLVGKYYVDLRQGADQERSYDDLLTTLYGHREVPPPLGPRRRAASRQLAGGHSDAVGAGEPIRILGVIADEVSEPRLDGTRGSGLYRIPLRLSRKPSAEWVELFERTWEHPPRYTTMHRRGILSVQGDRIVLDGTTMEEVERYHRDTLALVLDKVNAEMAEREQAERERVEAEARRRAEHRQSVEVAAGRLSFDAPTTSAVAASPSSSHSKGVQAWSVGGGATMVSPQGRDATGYAWKLRRGDETHGIVVWISGDVMASSNSALAPDVVKAKLSKGRSALERVLSLERLPAEILVTSDGIR